MLVVQTETIVFFLDKKSNFAQPSLLMVPDRW